MTVTLGSGLEEFVRKKVRSGSYRNASEYLAEVLRKEARGCRSTKHHRSASPTGAGKRKALAKGYRERSERDRLIAADWFGLEEELYERQAKRQSASR